MSEPKMCSDTGPCWDGYVYIGPKPRTKGSCISKAKLCNKTRGKGVECKSQIDCSDWVVQSGGSSNSTLVKIPKNVKQEALKGLDLLEKGFKGGTPTGWARAEQLTGSHIDSKSLADMRTWFARHGPDAVSGGTSYPGYLVWITDGSPTNSGFNDYKGAVSWLIWGGDAAYKWLKTDKIRKLLLNEFPKRKQASKTNNLVQFGGNPKIITN